MPVLTIEWPTAEEEDRSRRFQVNKNYLLALSQHLQNRYGTGLNVASEGLIRELRRQKGFSRMQRTGGADEKACRTALSLSWTGLIQLELASWSEVRFDLPYTNAWAPIHAYYAVYGGARAWLTAQGQPTTSHAATLKAIGSEVGSRRLYAAPWDVSCNGCCHDGSRTFCGVPGSHTSATPALLLQSPTPETFWPRYMKMLETTRRHVLDQRYIDWKQQHGRKRMLTTDKRSAAASVPPTTVFDFLWRLRVRSNYQGIEAYLMTNVAESWHRDFHESIRLVTHLSSLMFDCWIAQKIGPEKYTSAVDEFMKFRGHSPEPVRFLQSRREWLGSGAK